MEHRFSLLTSRSPSTSLKNGIQVLSLKPYPEIRIGYFLIEPMSCCIYHQERSYKKMEDWLQCLWHSQVRKWFHVPSSVVCFLVNNPPEDPTHSMKYFNRVQRGQSANLSVPSRVRFNKNLIACY